MGNFKIKSIWESKNTGGGSVPADLANRVQTLETDNTTNKTNIGNLQNDTVKISGNQDITGRKTFTSAGEAIQIKETGNNSGYITGYTDNTKKWAIGNNGSDNHFKLEASNANGNVILAPGTNGDVLSNSPKNWNQGVDNTIVRQKDLKYMRKQEYISNVTQPETDWNYSAWNWAMTDIKTDGLHDILVVFSFNDDKAVSFVMNIIWKNGIPEAQSNVIIIEKSGITFYFQGAIKSDGKLYIYHKKSASGGQNTNISWVRIYVLRDNNQPTKMSSVW